MRKQDASRGAPAWVLHLEPQAPASHAGLGDLCSRALVWGPAGPPELLLRGEGRRSSRGGQGPGAQRVTEATGRGAPSAGSGVPGRAVRSAIRAVLASARCPQAVRSARLPTPRTVAWRLSPGQGLALLGPCHSRVPPGKAVGSVLFPGPLSPGEHSPEPPLRLGPVCARSVMSGLCVPGSALGDRRRRCPRWEWTPHSCLHHAQNT